MIFKLELNRINSMVFGGAVLVLICQHYVRSLMEITIVYNKMYKYSSKIKI